MENAFKFEVYNKGIEIGAVKIDRTLLVQVNLVGDLAMLTPEQQHKVVSFIPVYKRYLETQEYQENLRARKKREELFSTVLSKEAISQMTELEFGQIMSSLWSSQMWGNKGYFVEKLIQDNTLPFLKDQLKKLLWGEGPLAERYNEFRKSSKGFGSAMLAEIISFVHPDQCGIWNDRARKAINHMGIQDTLPFLNKSQINGTELDKFNTLLVDIKTVLNAKGVKLVDLLDLNYWFYEIWKNHIPDEGILKPEEGITVPPLADFNHGDVIDQLLSIGQALGFQVEKEKTVAKGAKVDVVWKAQIANLGVVLYVFEVQKSGSIDSLILNLQRAQINQSVQRLIVVAKPKDIEKIKGEISTLPENFRRAVSYWEVDQAIRAASLVIELFEMINKLELVKSEFAALQ